MSLEIIDAIRRAEDAGADIVKKARDKAREIEAAAAADIVKMQNEYQNTAKKRREEILAEAVRAGEAKAAVIINDSRSEAAGIKKETQPRMDAAINIVIKKVVS